MTTLQQLALVDALRLSRGYRETLCAALDQLHDAQRTIDRQREQLAELREAQARYARQLFTGGQ